MTSRKTVAFATLGLLTGCGAAADLSVPGSAALPELTPTAPAGELVDKYDVASDLARLAELNIIDMGRLVEDYPYGAMNCYGPCPGFEDEIAEADLRQAARLHELVQIADRVATVNLDVAECNVEVIDDNLAALDSLDIVEVFGLVEEVPVSSPYCYNLPCSGDILAAEEINCQRATALANIVEETTEL